MRPIWKTRAFFTMFPCHNAVYELPQNLSFQERRPGSLPWQEEEEDIYGMGKASKCFKAPWIPNLS